jgi:hypothetical protein
MRCNGEVDDFTLAGYDLEELLGGGGGEVWRAREQATGELVALKRLRGSRRRRLDRAAAAGGRLACHGQARPCPTVARGRPRP